MFTLRHDNFGFTVAIQESGQTIIHLMAGSSFNQLNAPRVVDLLNKAAAAPELYEALKQEIIPKSSF